VRRVGRYEVTGELGRGGAGLVYRARDARDGRLVALKLMRGGGGDARRRFGREVQSLLRLRHSGVVAVRDAGQHEGTPYLVVDLVEGESLADRIGRDGPLPPPEAVRVARELAAALVHCHAQGVLHRDLKPANVLLDAEGRARLTDFGLARDLDASLGGSLTVAGRLLGTPGYWPPEQAGADLEAIGPRSDVFGLGAVLYAALTGRAPFAGETLPEVLAAMDGPVEPPSAHAPGVDPLLDAICLRCLERDPVRRFGSAAEVGEALAGYATPRPPAARRRDRTRRARRVAAVAAAVVVLAGATALGVWTHRDAARRERALLTTRLAQTTARAEALLTAVATGEEGPAREARAEAADRLAELETDGPQLAAAEVDEAALARAAALLRAAAGGEPPRPDRWGPDFAADALGDPEVALLVALRREVVAGGAGPRGVDEAAVRRRLDGPLGAAFRLLLARRIEQERPREALALLAPLPASTREEAAALPELLVALEEAPAQRLDARVEALPRARRAPVARRLRARALTVLRRRLATYQATPAELTRLLDLVAALPAAAARDDGAGIADRVVGRCRDLLTPLVERDVLAASLRGAASPEAGDVALAPLRAQAQRVATVLVSLGRSGLPPPEGGPIAPLSDDLLVLRSMGVLSSQDYTTVVQSLVRLDLAVPRRVLAGVLPAALSSGPTRDYLALRVAARQAGAAYDRDARPHQERLLTYALDDARARHLGPRARAQGLIEGISPSTPFPMARRAVDLAATLAPDDPWVLVQRATVLVATPGETPAEALRLADAALAALERAEAIGAARRFDRFFLFEDAIALHARYGDVDRARQILLETQVAEPPFTPEQLGQLRDALDAGRARR